MHHLPPLPLPDFPLPEPLLLLFDELHPYPPLSLRVPSLQPGMLNGGAVVGIGAVGGCCGGFVGLDGGGCVIQEIDLVR